MLVIADQGAARIGREGRLARAREAEEHRGVVRVADIDRAVHRQNAPLGQQIVEDGEHRLLDLARVGGASDQHLALGEIEQDKGARIGAVDRGIGSKARRVNDGEFGLVGFELAGSCRDQQVLREQAVPGLLRNHAHGQAKDRVGAAEAILDEQLPALEMGQHARAQGVEFFRVERPVDRTPPDIPGAGRFLDDELVVGRASRMLARFDDQRPVRRDAPLAPADGFLVEQRHRIIPMHVARVLDAVGLEAVADIEASVLRHCGPEKILILYRRPQWRFAKGGPLLRMTSRKRHSTMIRVCFQGRHSRNRHSPPCFSLSGPYGRVLQARSAPRALPPVP